MNHAHMVGGLHPGPFQLIVKSRVFIARQVEPGSVLHDAYADVAREIVGDQSVAIIDGPAENTSQHGERAFQDDQTPELRPPHTRWWNTLYDRINNVA